MHWFAPALAFAWLGHTLQAAAPAPLSWQELPGGRMAVLALPDSGKTGFTTLDPARLGITFSNRLAEARYLLTRDRRLLMRKSLVLGYLVRSLDPQVQLAEVSRRFGLARWAAPFRRCIRCNHLLESVEKSGIMDRLEPLTRVYFNEFRRCPSCKQIYWKGSHYERMQARIADLLARGST